ncbi:hypothetical protein [Microbacterium sp. B35-04]|uniref:hypothetical protein n=1 Tax=Microbacterium sp. B35-04 TaxID=1961716 RepID=UPI0013D62A40|nr:hypothetical protein [Microbacterium sp. B35-04]
MSTPEHPATPALTRKQIRELRNTGSNPVISDDPESDEPVEASAAPVEPAPVAEPISPPPSPFSGAPITAAPFAAAPVTAAPLTAAPFAAAPVTAAPFPRPAEPAAVAPAPMPDSAVDLGVSPLTRRQARQQERIRTASVPVITPEVVAAHAAATSGAVPAFAFPVAPPPAAPFRETESPLVTAPPDDSEVTTDSGMHALFGLPPESEPVAPAPSWQQPAAAASVAVPAFSAAPQAPELQEADEDEDEPFADVFGYAPTADEEAVDEPAAAPKAVSPLLGASLLDDAPAAPAPTAVEFPPSFDQLLSRTTGSIAIPNTLIVSQAPEVAPLVAPVTATGEVIITGTFNLPEGLGSTGHAKGTADGKEIDATLVDGELPSHSSPTPIAASAAVSTAKTPGEVIKPPTPEKGGKLMMSLAITAGVLALALVGVLILAFATGVF